MRRLVEHAVQLARDAELQLPPMILGGPTFCVSGWVRLQGWPIVLFLVIPIGVVRSYRCVECCGRCAELGWIAIGTTHHPSDLFVADAVFDSDVVGGF